MAFRFFPALALSSAVNGLRTVKNDSTPPHLSQAWIAESTGDGEPGKTGKEVTVHKYPDTFFKINFYRTYVYTVIYF